MSYILDALRKADRDRQVAQVPTLATTHASTMSLRRPAWIWAIAGVLAVTAGAAYTFVWAPGRPGPVRAAGPPPAVAPTAPGAGGSVGPATSGRPPQASQARNEAAMAPAPGPAIAQPPGSVGPLRSPVTPVPPPAKPSQAAPVPGDRGPSPDRGVTVAPEVGRGAPGPSFAAPAAPGEGATPEPRGGADAAAPPTFAAAPPPAPETDRAALGQAPPAPAAAPRAAEVTPGSPLAHGGGTSVEPRVEGDAVTPPAVATAPAASPEPRAGATPAQAPLQSLARFTLDVLVYSEVPAERLVFINGRKYVEGQTVDTDVVVEQITPDGAVVRHQGSYFLLRPKLNPYARPGSP
jgi:Type II secretion system protein B